jgi:glycogenin glucosyltransferase
MGAVAIGHNLRKFHGQKYDLICLVTPDVNGTWVAVLSQWWRVIRVPNYRPYPSFRRSWAKLYLWDQIQYRKIVYLDTDMLVMGNLDALFDYPMLSCASDPIPPQICNTGVLVIEPREGLLETMKRVVIERELFQGPGDQGFINGFFAGFTPLPAQFNTPRTQNLGLARLLRQNQTKVVHMVCKKPWKCGREGVSYCGCGYPSLNQVWWNVWDEACKDRLCLETWEEAKV